jgi:hypothetical protein
MLLGTYHMDNSGLDVAQIEVDDVLSSERQAQIQTVVEAIAKWKPERVAVERPYDRVDEVNSLYEEYRFGKRSYDAEEEIEPPHPFRNELTTECRSEVIQLGFRLADLLDHEEVYSIDYPMDIANDEYEELAEQGFEPDDKVSFEQIDMDEVGHEITEQIANSTIAVFLVWENQEKQLSREYDGLFGEYLRWGEEDNFGGPKLIANWYDRNLRMMHNLWRTTEPDDGRLILVVGSSHVNVLRDLLAITPMFCPVSPLPYLQSAI